MLKKSLPRRFIYIAIPVVLLLIFYMNLIKEEKTVVLIVLNGGSWKVINSLLQEDNLPTLRFIMENGVWGNLKTVHALRGEPEEYAQWGSISTGKKPEYHKFSGRLDSIKVKGIWNYSYEFKKKIGMFNWLPAWPLPSVNGFVIPSWSWTPEDVTYPPTLRKELNDLCVGRNINITPLIQNVEDKFLRQAIRTEFRELEKISTCFIHLKKKYKPKIYLVGIFGADHLQHYFWKYNFPKGFDISPHEVEKYKNIIPQFYINFDKLVLSKIVRDKGNILFLISDHDFQTQIPPTKLYLLNVNKILEAGGLLTYRKDFIDYSRTKAYTHFGIHIHYKCSLNQTCTVSSEKIEIYTINKSLSKEVTTFLKGVYVPRHGNFFKILKEEPHIIITLNLTTFMKLRNEINEVNISLSNNIFPLKKFLNVYEHSGEHGEDGIFIAYGKGIRKGYKIKNASILDILPTLLYAIDVPPPANLDGKILKEIFE